MSTFDAVTRTSVAKALIILLAAAAALAGAPGARAEGTNLATAYQLDAAHDGYQTASLATPLAKAWSVTLPGPVSYPLIVNGTVYVTARNAGSGTSLYAINQATGTTLWSHQLGGSYAWSALAYDGGQVFTVNNSGLLSAFDAASGQTNWATSLPGSDFTSAPTATNGDVYVGGDGVVGGGGALFAVTQATGQLVWTAPVENGDDSSPAADATGVYVTYACGQDYDFDPFSGHLIWHHTAPCEGGGGKTPALANGNVYGRDFGGNLILASDSGQPQGSFSSTPIPAVGGGQAFTVDGGALTAVSQSGLGTTAWTFTGDSHLDTAPLLVGDLVFEGSSSGEIYAVDDATGTSVWSANVGAAISGPDEQNVSQPLTGLAAGEGTLIVPAASTLTAYASASAPAGPPDNTQAPAVLGTPAIGRPVSADVGQWSPQATSYTYQWQRCDGAGDACTPIAGATNEAYTPADADLGATLKVTVTATNASGTGAPVSSAASAAVIAEGPTNTSVPSITGITTVGQTLTANPGTWTPAATRYSYQWFSCAPSIACAQITGASGSSFTLTSNEASKRIELEVTAFDSAGGSVPVFSSQTTPVNSAGGGTPVATRIALKSSKNPAGVDDTIVFTATISPSVNGGTVSFTENRLPLTGCTSGRLNAATLRVTCTVVAAKAATLIIGASYSGDGSYVGSAATLTQVIKSEVLPSRESVGRRKGARTTRGHPDFSLVLMAVRTHNVPHRYRFAAENVTCVGGADGVQITIGTSTVTVPCRASLALASRQVAARHTYQITARAVRYDKRRRIIARGRVYRLSLSVPGDDATWVQISGLEGP